MRAIQWKRTLIFYITREIIKHGTWYFYFKILFYSWFFSKSTFWRSTEKYKDERKGIILQHVISKFGICIFVLEILLFGRYSLPVFWNGTVSKWVPINTLHTFYAHEPYLFISSSMFAWSMISWRISVALRKAVAVSLTLGSSMTSLVLIKVNGRYGRGRSNENCNEWFTIVANSAKMKMLL